MTIEPATWEDRARALERLLMHYAEAVRLMRCLQRDRRPYEPLFAVKARADAEDEVDELTKLHALPPLDDVAAVDPDHSLTTQLPPPISGHPTT